MEVGGQAAEQPAQEPDRGESGAYRYHNPVSIAVGRGRSRSCRDPRGRRAVLVTFPEAEGLGLVARFARLARRSLAAVEIASSRTRRRAPRRDARALLAASTPAARPSWRVGGGSAIDTAKALMVGTASGRFDELVALLETGKPFAPHRVKALIAIPTTAGPGSEVTPWATIWDRAAARKHSLHLKETWPEAALVDPELMLTLPPGGHRPERARRAVARARIDLERECQSVSDTLAVAAAREAIDTLPRLLERPRDIGLRTRMSITALKAGLAFSNTKTALAHSISYEMTLRFGLPHGIACSFTLPMVPSARSGANADRDAVLPRSSSADLSGAPARLRRILRESGVPDFSETRHRFGVRNAWSRRPSRRPPARISSRGS
jgi:phosphonate metabolism-associated iron-containing alcohol dehydrogenase